MGKSKQDYISQVASDPNIPVFYQPWWLDILAGKDGWDAAVSYEKKRITGIWPYTIMRRWGQKISAPLPLTPYLGPHFYYPENQHKITARTSFIEKSLPEMIKQIQKEKFKLFTQYTAPGFYNGPALQWHDFSQKAMSRFVIHNLHDLPTVFKNFKYNTRHTIKKFNEYGNIKEEYNPTRLYELITASFNRRQQKPGYNETTFLALTEQLKERGALKIYFADHQQSKNVAGILVATSQERAYLLSTGMSEDQNGAVTALIWHSIQMTAKEVNTFDFCGSMIPGIYQFFRSFGGQLESYYQLRTFSGKGMKLLYNLSGKR